MLCTLTLFSLLSDIIETHSANSYSLKILQSDKLKGDFLGLTISEFTNQEKVSFFSAGTSPNFSHFPCQVKLALPLNSVLEGPEK